MSTSMLRAIQRHREIYLEHVRELRRTKVRHIRCRKGIQQNTDMVVQTNVKHALDQANLLTGVRNDIEFVQRGAWLAVVLTFPP